MVDYWLMVGICRICRCDYHSASVQSARQVQKRLMRGTIHATRVQQAAGEHFVVAKLCKASREALPSMDLSIKGALRQGDSVFVPTIYDPRHTRRYVDDSYGSFRSEKRVQYDVGSALLQVMTQGERIAPEDGICNVLLISKLDLRGLLLVLWPAKRAQSFG
jgi:hypothetical protein